MGICEPPCGGAVVPHAGTGSWKLLEASELWSWEQSNVIAKSHIQICAHRVCERDALCYGKYLWWTVDASNGK